ncbi:MAG: helix-turn-helix transcriptional regulator [Peptostreptococcaceae bacterium]|nr:helix-turn-helix transcriptional regulator [Peptostreptococcaceae bacterium]
MFNINIIKFLRLINSYTQEDVAKYLGCTVSTYNRKENCTVDFKAQEYVLLAELYNISINKLLDHKWFKQSILDVIYS